MAAPCSKLSASGSGNTLSGPSPTRSAAPPCPRTAATRSPSARPEPSGAERTTPAKSTPRVNGSSGLSWYCPLLSSRSGKEIPTAWVSTSTCGPKGPSAVGSGTSSTVTADGPSGRDTWTARIGTRLEGGPASALGTRFHEPFQLEVHRVGVVPGAAPGEAPSVEDRDDPAVHLADGAALVVGHVEVDGGAEAVERQRVAAGDVARHVAPA